MPRPAFPTTEVLVETLDPLRAAALDVPLPRDERTDASPFDFRRPSTFSREHVRCLEVAHEVFQRRFASRLSSALRTAVQLEPVSAEQLSYDDYIRSMPNPTVLTTVSLAPLPEAAILETNVQLALLLVDRMLGGRGKPVAPRRPTEVETFLIRELMSHAREAFRETMEPLVPVTPELATIDFNPQLVQVVPPSEVVLLLTYRLVVSQGDRAEGLITVCYPYATLAPALDRIANSLWLDPVSTPAPAVHEPALTGELHTTKVELSVRLQDSPTAASDLASLRVGDVLRLDHRVTEPVRGHVGGDDVLEGRIGRRGRRLAFQVLAWRPAPTPSPQEPDPAELTQRSPTPRPASEPTSDHAPAPAPAPPPAAAPTAAPTGSEVLVP